MTTPSALAQIAAVIFSIVWTFCDAPREPRPHATKLRLWADLAVRAAGWAVFMIGAYCATSWAVT